MFSTQSNMSQFLLLDPVALNASVHLAITLPFLNPRSYLAPHVLGFCIPQLFNCSPWSRLPLYLVTHVLETISCIMPMTCAYTSIQFSQFSFSANVLNSIHPIPEYIINFEVIGRTKFIYKSSCISSAANLGMLSRNITQILSISRIWDRFQGLGAFSTELGSSFRIGRPWGLEFPWAICSVSFKITCQTGYPFYIYVRQSGIDYRTNGFHFHCSEWLQDVPSRQELKKNFILRPIQHKNGALGVG